MSKPRRGVFERPLAQALIAALLVFGLLAAFLLLDFVLPPLTLNALLAVALLAFSHAMLQRRPFFKFKKLWQILGLTLGGVLIFVSLHFSGKVPHV